MEFCAAGYELADVVAYNCWNGESDQEQEDGNRRFPRTSRCGEAGSVWFGGGEGFDLVSSDVDFVVSFAPRTPARLFDRYFGLEEDLEALFGREVDLLMEVAMRNPTSSRA